MPMTTKAYPIVLRICGPVAAACILVSATGLQDAARTFHLAKQDPPSPYAASLARLPGRLYCKDRYWDEWHVTTGGELAGELRRSPSTSWCLHGLAQIEEKELIRVLDELNDLPSAGIELFAHQLSPGVVQALASCKLAILKVRSSTKDVDRTAALWTQAGLQAECWIVNEIPSFAESSSRPPRTAADLIVKAWVHSAWDLERISSLLPARRLHVSIGPMESTDHELLLLEFLKRLNGKTERTRITLAPSDVLTVSLASELWALSQRAELVASPTQWSTLTRNRPAGAAPWLSATVWAQSLSAEQLPGLDAIDSKLAFALHDTTSDETAPMWLAALGADAQRRVHSIDIRNSGFIQPGMFDRWQHCSDLRAVRIRNCGGIDVSDLCRLLAGNRVESLDISGTKCGGEWTAEQIPNVACLSRVDVSETGIGNRAVAVLLSAPKLRSIDLSGNPLTAEGFQRIEKCSNLERIIMRGLITDDRAVEQLARCKALIALDLQGSPRVSEGSMRKVLGIPTLEELNLSRCTALTSEAGLAIAGHSSIRDLVADDSKLVDDSVLQAIGQQSKLRSLSIVRNTQVSAKGLASLASCHSLRNLNLSGCSGLGKESIAQLRQALPACLVVSDE